MKSNNQHNVLNDHFILVYQMSGETRHPRKKRKFTHGVSLSSLIGRQVVMITCDQGKEKVSASHVFEMFNTYLEETTDDTEKSLEDELKELKKNKEKVQKVDVGRGIFFVYFNSEVNVLKLCSDLIKEAVESGQSRSTTVARIVPLVNVAKSTPEALTELFTEKVSKYFSKQNFPKNEEIRFGVQFRRRLSDNIRTEKTIETIAKIFSDACEKQNLPYKVDLKNPSLVVIIEVCKSIVGFSFVQNPKKMYKFNIQTASKQKANS
eukprot:snap_masked-scaffold_38-processed-gene-1.27-mRNA-1 protein AED:1.00 eAED:1.00 QI:0/0/0/0/1/1/2/0/263